MRQFHAAGWPKAIAAIETNDPHTRGIVVPGLDAPETELAASLAAAAALPQVGALSSGGRSGSGRDGGPPGCGAGGGAGVGMGQVRQQRDPVLPDLPGKV